MMARHALSLALVCLLPVVQAASAGESGRVVPVQGYDVPDQVRDPFFPLVTEVAEPAPAPPAPPARSSVAAVDLEALAGQIRLQTVISRGGQCLAVINRTLVKAGDTVDVSLQGRRIALRVAKLELEPPQARLLYGKQAVLVSPNGFVLEPEKETQHE